MNLKSIRMACDDGEIPWLAFLLLLAFLIRLIPALISHCWSDEFYTIIITQYSPLQIVKIATSTDMHPPLYYLLVKCFLEVGRRLGGGFETLAWLRLASVLPGFLTCVLAWHLGRQYWGRR